MSVVYPQQAVSLGTKLSSDWSKACTDYWVSQAMFGSATYTELAMLYRAAEGSINLPDYNYILNPYGVDDNKLKNFPAQLRNYDIIQPIIELFMGESAEKPSNMEVVTYGDDGTENSYKTDLEKKLKQIMAQDAINHLNAAGIDTGVDSQPVPTYESVVKDHETNWNDEQAIQGQQAIDYIFADIDWDEKKQRAFRDWLCTGRVFTYKEPVFNDVNLDVVSPLDFWFLKSVDSSFVEDGVAAVRRRFMLPNDIVDRFRHELKKSDIDKLEKLAQRVNTPSDPSGFVFLGSERMDNVNTVYGRFYGGRILVSHQVWKSLKEVKLLTYITELGVQEEMEVDEDYVLDIEAGDISLKSEWISEVWESYKIDEDIYIDARPRLDQRDEINNSSECKLPYNGRCDTTIDGEITSVVKRGLVYQTLFNIYHYKREMTINKNKDKIMLMPLGIIPKSFGKGGKDPMDKWNYFTEATSIAWFDESAPNANAAMQALKSVDMGLYQYIKGMDDVLISLKNEWWDAVGVNRQRYGDTQASDGKGVNEQAIFRSSIISAERNRKFNKFCEKEAQGLLDISKVAWINGKKATYVTSDRRRAFFNIDPMKHLSTNYGVFCVDSDKEHKQLEDLRATAKFMAQKGTMKTSMIAEVINANNFAKIKDTVKKAEELQERIEQANVEAEQRANQFATEVKQKEVETQSNDKRYVADRHYDAVVDAATISANAKAETPVEIDNSDNAEELAIKREDIHTKANLERAKLAETARKNNMDMALGVESLEVQREKIKADKQKAKSTK